MPQAGQRQCSAALRQYRSPQLPNRINDFAARLKSRRIAEAKECRSVAKSRDILSRISAKPGTE
jgi:hypothetical protein